MITLENYEEYLMLYVDNELDEASVKDLLQFLEQHPHLKSELEWYEKTKLTPATDLYFSHKEMLIKSAKRISLNRVLLLAAAASVALLFTFTAINKLRKADNIIIEQPVAIKTDSLPSKISGAVKKEKISPVSLPSAPVKQLPIMPSRSRNTVAVSRKISKPQQHTVTEKNQTSRTPAPVNPIVIKEEKEVAAPEEKYDKVVYTQKEKEITQPKTESGKKRNLLAKLFSSPEKQEGLQHLKNKVEEKVEAVKTINDNLKNTTVELKVGNKELLVFNF